MLPIVGGVNFPDPLKHLKFALSCDGKVVGLYKPYQTHLIMKNTIKIIIAFLITSSSVLAANHNDQSDRTYSRSQPVFVFRVKKEFKGGYIEVLSAEGKQVTAQRLMKRKVIIDFCDVKTGVYTIVVKKNDRVRKFEFVRK